MSVINRMLRDLDERKDPIGNGGAVGGDMIRSVKPAPSWRVGPKALLALIGIGVLGLALVWWLQPRGWTAARPFALAAPHAATAAVKLSLPAPLAMAAAAASAGAVSSAAATNQGAGATLVQLPLPAPVARGAAAKATAPPPTLAPRAAPIPTPARSPAVMLAATLPAAADAGGAPAASVLPPRATDLQARHGNGTAKTYSAKQVAGNLLSEAVLLDQQGRLDDAKTPLKRALAGDPLNVEARQMLVRLNVDTGHLDEAQALLTEGHRLVPGQAGFSLGLARLQAETGDVNGAIKLLQGGLTAAGDDAQHHALLAALLLRTQRHDEAVKHYLVALRADPANGSWLVGVGVALEALGKRTDAAEAYRRADGADRLTPELAKFVSDRLAQLGRRSL